MTNTLRKQLVFYQKQMVEAKTAGDSVAHLVYRDKTRQLAEIIKEKEKVSV